MIRMASSLALAGAVIALGLATVPAQAQANRTFVSGHGTDSGACNNVAAACRTFAYALSQTAPSGEIAVLDTAGYGAVTIANAVSIVNQGGDEAGISVASGGTAVTINAGSTDIVHLRGLTLEGAGVGAIGVALNSGGTLEIENCVIRHFTNKGVYINPGSGATLVSIANTTASDNGGEGIIFWASGAASITGIISRTTVENNGNGGIKVLNTGSGASSASVVDSIAFNNIGAAGFSALEAGATLRLGHSTANANSYGVLVSGGIVESYGDNDLRGNVSGSVSGSLTSVATQ